MQFVRQVDIGKRDCFPPGSNSFALLNNKTQQPQDNGWPWLGACDAWCLPFFCYGVNLAVGKPTTKPYKIQKSQNALSFSYHTDCFSTIQLWSSILKCFLDVCKSRIHNVYTKSVLKLTVLLLLLWLWSTQVPWAV